MQVEWLLLADSAQLVGGKLYLLGGGWDVLTVNTSFPLRQRCAIVAAFRVPWNETNVRHGVQLEVADEDGQTLLTAAGAVELGRPPGIPLGQEQRAQVVAELELSFERPGTYVVVARIEGEEHRRVPFRVVPGPLLLAQQQRHGEP
ncbi:MAG: hypothetical protein IT307_16680 [Chloroflexi bacterium]|nr:hypothetical protein [Chloroflexota bacterium]